VYRTANDDMERANGRWSYENVYRVLTPYPVSDEDLGRMTGRTWEEGKYASEVGFSFEHREEWLTGFPTFDGERKGSGDVDIAEGLFWIGDVRETGESMEMSCKMGKNVGRRIGMGGGGREEETDLCHEEL
jgi:hypothetical protein